MNLTEKQSSRKKAFTIIELLTIMSIIVILVSLLVPAMNQVKRYARTVSQKNQFHTIDVGLETYNAEWDLILGYPGSAWRTVDIDGTGYDSCGATELCAALVGRDLLGSDPDGSGDLKFYLKPDQSNAYRLQDLYYEKGAGGTTTLKVAGFYPAGFVLTDMFPRVEHERTGKLVGMPILYYKANVRGTEHPLEGNPATVEEKIYDYEDNVEFLKLGVPWDRFPPGGPKHELLEDPIRFYELTENKNIDVVINNERVIRPYRADSFILLSAGFDGEYGTGDDIFNFGN